MYHTPQKESKKNLYCSSWLKGHVSHAQAQSFCHELLGVWKSGNLEPEGEPEMETEPEPEPEPEPKK